MFWINPDYLSVCFHLLVKRGGRKPVILGKDTDLIIGKIEKCNIKLNIKKNMI